MADTVVKTFKDEKKRDRVITEMSKKGYTIQSINGSGGNFKAGKGVAMAAAGAVLLGPLGLLAGGLAGRKPQEWTIVFVKEK
jgi:hypothetical protein